jgi:hypothetical protein
LKKRPSSKVILSYPQLMDRPWSSSPHNHPLCGRIVGSAPSLIDQCLGLRWSHLRLR